MRAVILILIISFISCSTLNNNRNKEGKLCDENIKFNKIFFSHINNIETLISKSQNESFRNSLNFISEYVKVSFEEMSNFGNTYPIGAYEKDKLIWLRWYDENKCQNIQMK
jgi:hypothetical protein